MARAVSCWLVLLAAAVGAAGVDDPRDPKTWTPVKIPGRQAAPEFADFGEWLNGPPLTMKGLRGKVVVVHFMAFG